MNKIHSTRFVVDASVDPWCSIFPENQGQDERLVGEIVKLSGLPSLYVMVHDSDLLFVRLSELNKKTRSFCNAPQYAGAKIDAEPLADLPGAIGEFAGLDDGIRQAARSLVWRESTGFAEDLLEQLAGALSLPQCMRSFEDIEGKDYLPNRLKGLQWIPDLKVKKTIEAPERARIKELKKQGLLLFEKKVNGRGMGHAFSIAHNALNGHVAIKEHRYSDNGKIFWSSGAVDPLPAEAPKAWDVKHTGNWGGTLNPLKRFVVNRDGVVIRNLEENEHVHDPLLSPDNTLLFYWSVKGPCLLRLSDGEFTDLGMANFFGTLGNVRAIHDGAGHVLVNAGDRLALVEFSGKRVVGWGIPRFPVLSPEQLKQCAWRQESRELWEGMEHGILSRGGFPPNHVFTHWDPVNLGYIVQDGRFTSYISKARLLEFTGQAIVPEWSWFFSGCSADRLFRFLNGWQSNRFLYDSWRRWHWFVDGEGTLRAWEPGTNKRLSFLNTPWKLSSSSLELSAEGSMLICQGHIPRENFKYDISVQVYSVEKILENAVEDPTGFIDIAPSPD